MSLIFNEALLGAAGQGGAYEIEQSLRFANGGNYLTRTPSSAGSRTTWTHSVWVKYTIKSANHGVLLSAGSAGSNYDNIRISTTGHTPPTSLSWYAQNSSYSRTAAKIRDPSAWYHFVFVWDTTNGTAADRRRMYINGERVTDFYDNSNPGSSTQSYVNNNWLHAIGALTYNVSTTSEAMDGYMAEIHFVDGTAKDPTDFGENDDNGVWRPIRYTGSYGTNGYYLDFSNSSNLGEDQSGNGNDWTASGFNTSGTSTDIMSDTPTTNYCTWNPLFKQGGSPSYSEANLKVAGSPNSPILGTIGVSSGKWYWEVKPSSNSSLIGICGPVLSSYSGNLYDQSTGYCYASDGRKGNNGSLSSYGASYSNDLIGVALDLDAGTLVFYKNGTSQGTAFTGLSGTFFPAVSDWGTDINFTLNCGQRAFEQTVPTGYSALNTSNLPAPSIEDGSQYFNTALWTGNGSSQSITGVGFQPDFLWAKARNQSYWHRLHDAVRGRLISLYSNESNAEASQANSITSFDSDGFTLGSDGSHNGSGVTYVGWSWLAGNGTSSNTNGSITSTVSANSSAGFSIVTYTAENAVRTIGHDLGVKPKLIIVKDREATQNWAVYHGSLGATKGLYLDTSAKQETNSGYWNDTEPTSTVFTVGTNTRTGGSTNDFIAYCFAEVEGYSRMSTYSANGNTDGPFVYCGFRPAFILIKNYAGGSEVPWVIYDTTRDTYNLSQKRLFPSLSSTEESDSTRGIDILSNGFKVRNNHASINESGCEHAFWAVAENPFGGQGASPITAR